MDRDNLSLSKKLILGVRSLFNLCSEISKRNITVMQAVLDIRMRLFNSQRSLRDDFDWTKYPRHYREELKSVSRKHTLNVGVGEFNLVHGEIILDTNAKPLHPNHRLLYEVVIALNPNSMREIGFGAGDHLSNLSNMLPGSKLFGIDRSMEQLNTLRVRHPKLQAKLSVTDITDRQIELEAVDLSFTQAVLMHISELNDRYLSAIENILDSTLNHIVLMENWTQHDYIGSIRQLIVSKSNWQNAKLYFKVSSENPNVRCLIVSKLPCSFPLLVNDDQLLQGQNLLTH
jgi:hypothetical protein